MVNVDLMTGKNYSTTLNGLFRKVIWFCSIPTGYINSMFSVILEMSEIRTYYPIEPKRHSKYLDKSFVVMSI